jgi:phage tail sheath gpL-like
MSNLSSNSLAAAVGAAVKNKQFVSSAELVPRKILIIGTGDPTTEAANPTDTPVLVTSPEDVADKTGFGFMLHRLAIQAYRGSKGIETWIIQQPEGVAVQAAGEIDFTGSTGVLAGTLYLYIAGEQISVTITDAMTVEDIADAVVTEITANPDLPVTAVKVAVTFEVTITAKSGGLWGNDIDISLNLGAGETTPTGITVAITGMASGTGTPDIQTALDSLGTGDGANEAFFTDLIQGYGQVTAVLDDIANYVGQGNTFIGLYDKVVHKPFRVLIGDVAAGSAGLSALITLGDGRKNDRANGVIAVPGSESHPSEIAAQAMGHMARINNVRAQENYLDIILEGIQPGETKSDRWTKDYNSRDTAVKAGVSPTIVKSGVVVMQNVVTFYHPDSVPQASNGYRSMRNISILQNILNNMAVNFEQEKWKGISIVADVTKVSNTTDKQKARDIDSVRDDLVALARSFESKSWLYAASFTIDSLKETGAIAVRTGGDGFEVVWKIVLSGEGNIIDTVTEFDTSIAVFLT